jgi:hypothetical protein
MKTPCWKIINFNGETQSRATEIKTVESLDNQNCLVVFKTGFRKVVRHGERIAVGCEYFVADNIHEPANTANISHAELTNSWAAMRINIRHLIFISPKPRLKAFFSLLALTAVFPLFFSLSNIAEAPEMRPMNPASAHLLAYLDKALRNASNLSTEIPQDPQTAREEIAPSQLSHIKKGRPKKRLSKTTPTRNRTNIDSEIMRFLPEEKK